MADLVTLHVLLEERQVTRAARRLGITQSSMSHRLAQLRQSLDDPLFVRSGSHLVPTPRALEMARPLGDGLAKLEEAIQPPTIFDPRTACFEVELHVPDLLIPAALELSSVLAKAAPQVTLRVRGISANMDTLLGEKVRSLALVPAHFLGPGLRTRSVGTVTFAIVGRCGHPLFKRPMTRQRWLAYPQVVVVTGNQRKNAIEEVLRKHKFERKIGLEVPSFLAALLALVKSDLVMNAPVPIGYEAFEAMGLRSAPPPFPLPSTRISMGWHERFHLDPAHRWFRDLTLNALRSRFDTSQRARR